MLSSTQWAWLEEELTKEAEITVIVSGVQVVILTVVDSESESCDSESESDDLYDNF